MLFYFILFLFKFFICGRWAKINEQIQYSRTNIFEGDSTYDEHLHYLFSGELPNLVRYCERIRRKFWPEWVLDYEELYSEMCTDSPTQHSLFSCADTLDEMDTHTLSHKRSPDTDSGRSISDSDIEVDESGAELKVNAWKTFYVSGFFAERRGVPDAHMQFIS